MFVAKSKVQRKAVVHPPIIGNVGAGLRAHGFRPRPLVILAGGRVCAKQKCRHAVGRVLAALFGSPVKVRLKENAPSPLVRLESQ